MKVERNVKEVQGSLRKSKDKKEERKKEGKKSEKKVVRGPSVKPRNPLLVNVTLFTRTNKAS